MMLGYITAARAKALGFTHHGKCFGIPIWIGDPFGMCMVATKWAPMEPLMTLAQAIEQLLHALFWPDAEPGFQFQLGSPIDESGDFRGR